MEEDTWHLTSSSSASIGCWVGRFVCVDVEALDGISVGDPVMASLISGCCFIGTDVGVADGHFVGFLVLGVSVGCLVGSADGVDFGDGWFVGNLATGVSVRD